MSAKIFAIVNQKGGTGKTTTTVNLGCAIAKLGKKVLLVDFDAQASLTFYLGISHLPKGNVADVIFGDRELTDVLVHKEGVSILPASSDLADAELSLASYEQRTEVLKRLLEPLEKEYDYILIDCGPSLSILTVNALNVAHEVIIPLELEVLALQGLQLISRTIQKIKKTLNPQLAIRGILLLKVDLAKKITQEVYQLLLSSCPEHIFKAHIEFDEKAIEAPSFGQSVVSYAPNSICTLGYLDLAMEILAKE